MPGSDAEKAVRYGVTLPTISRWGNGTRTPADDAIKKQIEADGGPLVCEWDELPAKVAARPAPPPPAAGADATPDAVTAEANRLLAMVRQANSDAATEDDIVRRVAAFASCATVMQRLGRLVGAGHAVTERQILDSPHMRIISDRIITALEPWPDALAAVAAALESTSAQPA
jgi:hypothetical protein